MLLNDDQRKILAAIDETAEEAVSISQQIHRRPEIAFEEHFASDLLEKSLEKHGFHVDSSIAHIPTAFRACRGAAESPSVAFLAEYDALKSMGHACGHNLIAAMSFLAGIGLGAVAGSLPGQVVVLGTPAEEGAGAKIPMLERGAFDRLDAVMMAHPYIGNYLATESLSMEDIRMRFYGRAAHAVAQPWMGHNALDGLLLAFNSVNAMRASLRDDARIHGVITQGGITPSIIPSHAEAHFYLHARDRVYLEEMIKKFEAAAEAAAVATSTRVEFDHYPYQFNDMVNNLTLAGRVRDYLVGEFAFGSFGPRSEFFGPVDLGNVSHFIPSIHILVDIGQGTLYSPHTEEFCVAAASDHASQVLVNSAKALALAGYDFLTDPLLQERVRSEFVASVGRQPGYHGKI